MSDPPRRGGVGDFSMFDLVHFYMFADTHPSMGYKRLTWDMIDRDIAYLRPGQVYQVLQSANLLARGPPARA